MNVVVWGIREQRRGMVGSLRGHGFKIEMIRRLAELKPLESQPDVVLLDAGDMDDVFLDFCLRLRTLCDVPTIAMTSYTHGPTWIRAYEAGVDEFLVDPFALPELVARLHWISRPPRSALTGVSSPAVVYGPVRISEQSRKVFIREMPVDLSPKEYQLMVILARRAGQVVTRDQLVSRLWPEGYDNAERRLEVHVAELRKKLAVPGLLSTVRGVGYRLVSQESYVRLEPK
jgi:DNA-binding response OmpR family regulator